MSGRRRVRWRADHEKPVLNDNFERRGWVPASGPDDWNFYWATIHSVKALFHPDTGTRLHDSQIVNHYANHYELTRKDLMAKNVKRYLKECQRGLVSLPGSILGAAHGHSHSSSSSTSSSSSSLSHSGPGGSGGSGASGSGSGAGGPGSGAPGQSGGDGAGSQGGGGLPDFLPATYALPQDYGVFVEEFRRHPQGTTWIMKPSGKSQGSGIFLVDRLSQVKRWARDSGRPGGGVDSYVISRYVDRPLLIGGKKFDLRMYVLVTSWRPLMAYRHGLGFARFCAVKYDASDLGNSFVHLTNVAVQKKGGDYDETNGGKWAMSSFWLYIESTRGRAAAKKLEEDIDLVFLLSLKACQNAISNDPHAFEVYGYDIIIDEDLKPWLIEANASPSLSSTTDLDRAMKSALIKDTLNIVVPPDFPEHRGTRGGGGVNVYPRPGMDMGHYEVLYDEAAELDAERAKREADASSSRYGSRRGANRR